MLCHGNAEAVDAKFSLAIDLKFSLIFSFHLRYSVPEKGWDPRAQGRPVNKHWEVTKTQIMKLRLRRWLRFKMFISLIDLNFADGRLWDVLRSIKSKRIIEMNSQCFYGHVISREARLSLPSLKIERSGHNECQWVTNMFQVFWTWRCTHSRELKH